MRTTAGLATALWLLCTTVAVHGQQCETFDECMAGMCTNGQCVGVPLNTGSCNDGNPCTTNDSCVNGECEGTPTAGGTCDDFQECTTNDRCTDFGGGNIACMGTGAAPVGTRCAGGCGTCQQTFPSPAPPQCQADPERTGGSCEPIGGEDLPCLDGECRVQGVPPFQFPLCFPIARVCPNTDGDPCTGEFCNFETGECETAPRPIQPNCFPAECTRCRPADGSCIPDNVGQSCDDGNVCTASTVCNAQGSCVAGTAQSSPTPTRTTGGNTPTPTVTTGSGTPTNTVAINTATPTNTPGTPTATPTQGRCVGDCNNNGTVAVNELVVGVNIALDRADIDDCPQFDINSSGGAEVNELVSGVNSLLRGCIAAAARAQ